MESVHWRGDDTASMAFAVLGESLAAFRRYHVYKLYYMYNNHLYMHD